MPFAMGLCQCAALMNPARIQSNRFHANLLAPHLAYALQHLIALPLLAGVRLAEGSHHVFCKHSQGMAITPDTDMLGNTSSSMHSAHRAEAGLLCLWTGESMTPRPPAASTCQLQCVRMTTCALTCAKSPAYRASAPCSHVAGRAWPDPCNDRRGGRRRSVPPTTYSSTHSASQSTGRPSTRPPAVLPRRVTAELIHAARSRSRTRQRHLQLAYRFINLLRVLCVHMVVQPMLGAEHRITEPALPEMSPQRHLVPLLPRVSVRWRAL